MFPRRPENLNHSTHGKKNSITKIQLDCQPIPFDCIDVIIRSVAFVSSPSTRRLKLESIIDGAPS
uniref:Uncharacterized protein n=1 Tax=Candidatus Kentrum sp. TC TaxID=2126339 RepID=A0A450ZZQ8_9GAMM|nr:MAG: hypothetical protein BECKTC1821D_GA0114238_10846 [Candidatus Kentron sp. TC]VFK59265.1 MAG: hypothetical protein BECKTC1821F_GA0114240_10317 [Candidatus Kentron sp. TC]